MHRHVNRLSPGWISVGGRKIFRQFLRGHAVESLGGRKILFSRRLGVTDAEKRGAPQGPLDGDSARSVNLDARLDEFDGPSVQAAGNSSSSTDGPSSSTDDPTRSSDGPKGFPDRSTASPDVRRPCRDIRQGLREARRGRWTVRRALWESRGVVGPSVEVVGRLVEVVGRSVDLDARLDEAAGSLNPGFVYLRLDPAPPDNRRAPRRGTAAALDPAAAVPDSVFKERCIRTRPIRRRRGADPKEKYIMGS